MPSNDDNIEHLPDEEKEAPDDLIFEEEGEVGADTIKKLRAKLKQAEHDRGEYLSGWQRAKADYINLRNTEEKAKQDIGRMVKESLLLDLIPVLDTFEIAFANQAAWEELPKNWRNGMEHIYNQLKSTLQDHGLTEIEAAPGTNFNPEVHHSIATLDVDSPEADNKVREVVRKGYKLGSKIIRPTQVKVGTYKAN